MTASGLLQMGEDEDCTDALCAEEMVASLAEDVCNSLEGNEDSAEEAEQINSEFSDEFCFRSLVGLTKAVL